jgi:hypothetical protein
MALRFITADTDRRMTALVVGRAGIGKTSLLRTIPPGESACTISAEAGLLCVRDMVEDGRIRGVELSSTAEVLECIDNLRFNASWKEDFAWVFVDSLTEISSICYEELKAKYPDKRDSYNMWDAYAGMMNRIVKGFRDLGKYHVVMTCLETTDLDDSKRRIVSPDVQLKSFRQRLPALFDEILYMTTEDVPADGGEPRRVFYTEPFDSRPGKDRSGRLAPVEVPDLGLVRDKILNAGA